MLQCTAVTEIPVPEALVALLDLEGGPDDPRDAMADDCFLLCELGEHDESVEHATHLWTAEPHGEQDLWLLWAGTGARIASAGSRRRLRALPSSVTSVRGLWSRACSSTGTAPARTASP
ncbi:hypothetical protein ABZ763_04500 [Streptomyces bacillaris]|uniref:hypothetical protein n=1 Tax=Streptomyces bacillaris TaxID=68179 RepID=UPI00346086D3